MMSAPLDRQQRDRIERRQRKCMRRSKDAARLLDLCAGSPRAQTRSLIFPGSAGRATP